MDSVEVDKLLADELRLKHWYCTLMFDVAGLERTHDILQYVKPNPLSKDAQIIMECIMHSQRISQALHICRN
jgi:hypothetical protein